jgi:molecular chaperone GrpE (heat shock protein)
MKEEIVSVEKEEIKKREVEEQEAPHFTVRDKRFWVEKEGEGEAPPEERLPTYVEQLKNQAEESERKLKEYIAAYKQKMAENDDFRKRLEANYQKRAEVANAEFILNLLPVIDNLNRAIFAAENSRDFDSLFKGIKMIQASFINQLKNCCVEKIDAAGKAFNPADEEAVEVVEVDVKEKDNSVIEELECGYKIKERLLRPAKVRVGRYSGK